MKNGSRGNGVKQVTFRVCTQPGCEVSVAGTFNGWKPGELKLKQVDGQGIYQTRVKLPLGRHEYKFVVDQVWCVDPACPEMAANEFGSLNSVIQVQ